MQRENYPDRFITKAARYIQGRSISSAFLTLTIFSSLSCCFLLTENFSVWKKIDSKNSDIFKEIIFILSLPDFRYFFHLQFLNLNNLINLLRKKKNKPQLYYILIKLQVIINQVLIILFFVLISIIHHL